MPGNQALLIGCNNPYLEGGIIAADPPPTGLVPLAIKRDACPVAAFDDLGACRGVVLANPAGKDEAIEAAQRCRQRADLADDTIYKQIDRLTRPRGGGSPQRPHVRRNTGNPEQT